jgi:hypothetical protein
MSVNWDFLGVEMFLKIDEADYEIFVNSGIYIDCQLG